MLINLHVRPANLYDSIFDRVGHNRFLERIGNDRFIVSPEFDFYLKALFQLFDKKAFMLQAAHNIQPVQIGFGIFNGRLAAAVQRVADIIEKPYIQGSLGLAILGRQVIVDIHIELEMVAFFIPVEKIKRYQTLNGISQNGNKGALLAEGIQGDFAEVKMTGNEPELRLGKIVEQHVLTEPEQLVDVGRTKGGVKMAAQLGGLQ